jgi:hypothetical protein
MAGLLDIFGTGGVDTMGLLGMSQGDISRNRDDAQAQALYALAGRLFQGGNTGQSIAEGLQAGQKAYKGGMQDTLQTQLQNYQLQELLRKRKEEELTKQQQLQAQQILAKAYSPETFAETPLTNIFGQEVAGPNQPQAAGAAKVRWGTGCLIKQRAFVVFSVRVGRMPAHRVGAGSNLRSQPTCDSS